MTGKRSMFGSLAQRGVAGQPTHPAERARRRTRHVYVAVRAGEEIRERPGVLLDWARETSGWVARVAYVADEDGTLVVARFPAAELHPVPTED